MLPSGVRKANADLQFAEYYIARLLGFETITFERDCFENRLFEAVAATNLIMPFRAQSRAELPTILEILGIYTPEMTVHPCIPDIFSKSRNFCADRSCSGEYLALRSLLVPTSSALQ